jgi:hypothetical protein
MSIPLAGRTRWNALGFRPPTPFAQYVEASGSRISLLLPGPRTTQDWWICCFLWLCGSRAPMLGYLLPHYDNGWTTMKAAVG